MQLVMLAMGIWLYMSMHYMVVYLHSRHEKSNLAYSLLCMVFCLMVFVLHIYPRLGFFDPSTFQAIRVCCSALIGVAIANFSRTIFDLTAIKRAFRIILWAMPLIVFPLAVLSVITQALAFIWVAFMIMSTGAITILIMALIQIVKLKQYRDRKRKLVLIGFISLLLQGVWFMIYEGIFNHGGGEKNIILERPGLIIMAFLFAFALLDGFQREHRELMDLKTTLEKKVQERTIQLSEAHQQKTMFFVNMAHETKTPLTLIANYLNHVIATHGLTYEARIMKQNIDKLIRDIVNILNIEALNYQKNVYNNEKVADLSMIIRRRTELFMHIAEKRSIALSYEVPERAFVKIDPLAVEIILNNLLDNAIKYNRANGTIHVRMTEEAGTCFISVADTGEGMEPGKIANIFDQFYQISRDKRSREGMGIGLHLVKKVVELSGGGIAVESEPGKGSCFRLWFNAYDPAPGEEASAYVDDGLSPPLETEEVELKDSARIEGRQNVLVVEDNRNMLFFLQEMISKKYNFFFAENGKRAMKLLEAMPRPDLIISDIMMDEMDGLEFLSCIRGNEEYDGIPFIFISAKATDEDKLSGLREGAVDFIAKPFDAQELMARIDSMLAVERGSRKYLLAEVNKNLRDFVVDRREPVEQVSTPNAVNAPAGVPFQISQREMEVVNLMYKGFLYKEIADELDISLNTVETYRKRIFKKCGVQTKTDLLNAIFRGEVLSGTN